MNISARSRRHAVWIRVPLLGLSERQELEETAQSIGAHAISDQVSQRAEWVQFRFASNADAATFRANACDIAGALVEPDEPLQREERRTKTS